MKVTSRARRNVLIVLGVGVDIMRTTRAGPFPTLLTVAHAHVGAAGVITAETRGYGTMKRCLRGTFLTKISGVFGCTKSSFAIGSEDYPVCNETMVEASHLTLLRIIRRSLLSTRGSSREPLVSLIRVIGMVIPALQSSVNLEVKVGEPQE